MSIYSAFHIRDARSLFAFCILLTVVFFSRIQPCCVHVDLLVKSILVVYEIVFELLLAIDLVSVLAMYPYCLDRSLFYDVYCFLT